MRKTTDVGGGEAIKFDSGAIRSKVVTEYRLIPKEFLRRLAARYEVGLVKYTENNWKRGLRDKKFRDQLFNHTVEHLWDWLENGCKEDDNLAAAAWGIAAMMEAERVDREGSSIGDTSGVESPRKISRGQRPRPPVVERRSGGSRKGGRGSDKTTKTGNPPGHPPELSPGGTGPGGGRVFDVDNQYRSGKEKR